MQNKSIGVDSFINQTPCDDTIENKELLPFKLVLDEAFSRNQHFNWYEQHPPALLRFRKLLKAIISDIKKMEIDYQIPVLKREDDITGFKLILTIPKYKIYRECFISELELEALSQHPVFSAHFKKYSTTD